MKQVFLSYSTVDKEQTVEIRNMLECNGISCWMGNRNILGGNTFTDEITKAIEQCRVFVLVMSKFAQESHWVFRELEYAIKNKKIIIPYILEEMEFNRNFHFMLAVNNGINAYEYAGDSREELLRRILFFIDTDSEKISDQINRIRYACPLCGSERVGDCLGFWEVMYLRCLKPVLLIMGILIALNLVFVLLLYILAVVSALLPVIQGRELIMMQFMESEMLQNILYPFLWGYGAICLFCFFVLFSGGIASLYAEKIKREKGIVVHTFRCYNCNNRFRKRIKVEI